MLTQRPGHRGFHLQPHHSLDLAMLQQCHPPAAEEARTHRCQIDARAAPPSRRPSFVPTLPDHSMTPAPPSSHLQTVAPSLHPTIHQQMHCSQPNPLAPPKVPEPPQASAAHMHLPPAPKFRHCPSDRSPLQCPPKTLPYCRTADSNLLCRSAPVRSRSPIRCPAHCLLRCLRCPSHR